MSNLIEYRGRVIELTFTPGDRPRHVLPRARVLRGEPLTRDDRRGLSRLVSRRVRRLGTNWEAGE